MISFQNLKGNKIYKENYHKSPFPYELVYTENSAARIIGSSAATAQEPPLKKKLFVGVKEDDYVSK